jgi:hypothetical protein
MLMLLTKTQLIFLFFFLFISFSGCAHKDSERAESILPDPNGVSIFERFPAPKGYQKQMNSNGSWAAFLQQYPLLKSGSPILDYKGNAISDQKNHSAVLKIDIGNRDLQQCADAVIRLRAEYLWEINKKEDISFNFTSGHAYPWRDYAAGVRPEVNGNKVSFNQTASQSNSYEAFRKYLDIIFMYAGTISLHRDMKTINRKSEYQIGDVLVHPGSPGHAVIIVDKAKNGKGEAIYLLAQGYTPAQSIHIVKSGHFGISPWFKIPQSGPIWHNRFFLGKVGVRRF